MCVQISWVIKIPQATKNYNEEEKKEVKKLL